jgi:hypothetical protein
MPSILKLVVYSGVGFSVTKQIGVESRHRFVDKESLSIYRFIEKYYTCDFIP